MKFKKPNFFCYLLARAVSWLAATLVFKRKFIRNEIKKVKGPYVVIANHQAALDFVNLIGATPRRMSFVISKSFYSTLPIQGILKKMGVIPKQQFQTTVKDMKRMKAVIDHEQPLVIYPAGLMCEDGLSTPIPAATYKFLKWLGVDIYAARSSGTYFSMPKWGKGLRPGRTYLDVYKLFDAAELAQLDVEEIRARTDAALLFDAYREQEALPQQHRGSGRNIEGLENVLYQCPNCGREFSMRVRDKNTIYCTDCGYEQVSDACAFLHNCRGLGKELRYVSDWSRLIYDRLRQRMAGGEALSLSAPTAIHMVNEKKKKPFLIGFL